MRARTNRLTVRYKPLLSIARLFIEGKSPDVVPGSGDGFALLFDMDQWLEVSIEILMERDEGCRYLVTSVTSISESDPQKCPPRSEQASWLPAGENCAMGFV